MKKLLHPVRWAYDKVTTSQWAPILFISGIILLAWRIYSNWKMNRIFNKRYDLLMKQSAASAKVKQMHEEQVSTMKEIEQLDQQLTKDVEKLKERKHETLAEWLDRWNSPNFPD